MYINFLIKIKNAQKAGKKGMKSQFSKNDAAIAELLVARKFLKSSEVKGRAPKKYIELELDSERKIDTVKFLSRPSSRIYSGYNDIKRVKGGYGIIVLSTPKGILSGDEARKQKVGGQLLFEIW